MMNVFRQSLPNIIGGLAVVLIMSIVGWFWSQSDSDATNETIITFPKEGASVSRMAQFSGVYSNTYNEQDLWLVVQPVLSPTYHPQRSKIPKSNNNWKAVAYVGESEKHNIGEEFIVHLVSATTSASSKFKEYLVESAKRKSWVGLEDLPNGAIALYSISITRN